MKRERNVINFRSECDNGITLTQGGDGSCFLVLRVNGKGLRHIDLSRASGRGRDGEVVLLDLEDRSKYCME